MKNEQYHIDVTPEEDALFRDQETRETSLNKPKFTKVFWVVLGVHVAVIGTIITTCSAMGSRSSINLKQPVAEIPETLQREEFVSSDILEQQTQAVALAAPSPSPIPTQESAVVTETPSPIVETPSPIVEKDVPQVVEVKPKTAQQPKLIKEYVVKKGDTIISISKKYKLSTKRLIEINKIKDPNSIKVGQVLKFM